MKKKLTGIFFFLFVLSSPAIFGNEQTAVWQRIYQNSVNDEMRYAVLLNIQELRDTGFTDLLTQALSSLLMRGIESGNLQDVEMKVKLATLLVRQLGQFHATTAADEVFQVYQEVKEHPFLKAEAAMALGEMHATDDVPYLVRSLNDLNLAPNPRNAEAQEILAFGLVQSLALMHDPRGYEPVFYASIGWYGPERKVKETARKLLKTMVPDPTDSLIKIIKSQTNFKNMRYALQAEDDSHAPDASKSRAALVALSQGVKFIANGVEQSLDLATLRAKALQMLIAEKDHSEAAVALYRQDYKTARLAKQTDEVLTVIQALGVNGTASAASYLAELLNNFNTEFNNGLTLSDFQLQELKTVLWAMQLAKNPTVRPALLEAQFLYTPAIQDDVKAVLASLPTN